MSITLLASYKDIHITSLLALDLQRARTVSEDMLPDNVIRRVYIKLWLPYIPEKPVLTIIASLLFAPGELPRLRRLVTPLTFIFLS